MNANPEHILISLESRHAENILDGKKHVELRRRAMRIGPGATVWIYSKQPVGSVVGKAIVRKVVSGSPATLWREFGEASAISRKEFFDYFSGSEDAQAVTLEGATRLAYHLTLARMRELVGRFNPPQFFHRLRADNPIRRAVEEAVA